MRASLSPSPACTTSGRRPAFTAAAAALPARAGRGRRAVCVRAAQVQLAMPSGEVHTLEVPQGSSILEVALDLGLEVPHDCKMGVCMNCSAKLVEGAVDQRAGMLSEEVQEKGYALLCVAIPQGDCSVRVVPEEELMDEVMMGDAA